MRVLHLLDATVRWDQRLAVEQLSDRLPADRIAQQWVSLGPPKGEWVHLPPPERVVPCRFGLGFFATAPLANLATDSEADVLHAWSVRSAYVALAIEQDRAAVAVSLSDPMQAKALAQLWDARGRSTGAAVLCATEVVRQRLVERGVPAEDTVLVRPGVDFATLNRARKSDLRSRLGLPSDAVVLFTDHPPTRDGGQFCAFWATAVRSFLEPNVRLMVPGSGREADRLRRLAEAVRMTELLVLAGERFRYEELMGAVDVLMLPSAMETSVTAVGWAMAAGVPVIACATRAVAELLAHGQNAFLIKPDVTKRLALRFAAALEHRRQWIRQIEVARGQAYALFGLRRFVEQVQNVYDNLIEGRKAAGRIQYPAIFEK